MLLISLLTIIPTFEASSDLKTYFVKDDYPTIQTAIDAANSGDTIIVKSGI